MNKNLKKVKIITKVGTIKEVRFPMDEPTYKIWLNPTIPEDVKLRYFAELYYSYVDEGHYSRNHIPFSDLTQKQWHELNEKSIEQQEEEQQRKEDEEELNAMVATLSEKQQYVINRTKASMSEDEKISQLFCLIAYSSEEDYLDYLSTKLKVGGIMCRVMPTEEVIKTVTLLQKKSKVPMLVSANLEAGGNGVSLEGTKIGAEMAIAASKNPSLGDALGDVSGKEGAALGLNWSFAPITDLDLNFRNPITNTRTFGSNVQDVASLSVRYIKNLQKHGLAATFKHFPGDGVDERDQHLVTSVNTLSTEEWDRTYGEIYRQCIEAGSLTCMVGHLSLPSYTKYFSPDIKDEDILPSSVNYDICTSLLREKLGFNGLVISDSTTMAGINGALKREQLVPGVIAAGCDMFLFTRNLEEDFFYMKEGVRKGVITKERLDDAVTRILALKAALHLHKKNNIPSLEEAKKVLNDKESKKLARKCADESITLVKSKQDVFPITTEKYPRILFYSLQSGEGQMGYGINTGANALFMKKLEEKGFKVTLFRPKEGFEGMMTSAKEIIDNYDLILYSANYATKSNQTIVRIEWAQPMGSDVPTYIHSVPTVFVSLENPYHLLDVPRVRTYINTYGSTATIIDSLIDKMMGKDEFRGVSPVDAFCGKWDTHL